LPAALWDKNVKGALAGFRVGSPGLPYLDGLDPTYATGGGLGLYVQRGSASFRRVAVEPLDKPD
jgi:hypothetical protein